MPPRPLCLRPDGLDDGVNVNLFRARSPRLCEKDAAFAWLEKAFQEHATFLRYLKVHPLFDGLRDDPRFDALVKRMGIPD